MPALLDNMRDGVGSAVADGTYLASNKAMFELVDIPRETELARERDAAETARAADDIGG
jgi:PAS domain-containing protein